MTWTIVYSKCYCRHHLSSTNYKYESLTGKVLYVHNVEVAGDAWMLRLIVTQGWATADFQRQISVQQAPTKIAVPRAISPGGAGDLQRNATSNKTIFRQTYNLYTHHLPLSLDKNSFHIAILCLRSLSRVGDLERATGVGLALGATWSIQQTGADIQYGTSQTAGWQILATIS